jgi:Flp pilus assembly pilin Flp
MKKKLSGQGLTEYAILIALIAIGIVLLLNLMGISVRDIYCNVADGISGGSGCKMAMFCQDNFSTNLSGWTTQQGTAGGVQNGQYCPPSYSLMLNKCAAAANLKDYTVKLDGAMLNSGNGYGIMFRTQMTPTGLAGYAFQYDPGLKGFVIRKWANGVEINPAIAFVSAPNYDWYSAAHNIQLDVKGGTFTAFIDGKQVLTAQDSTYSSGGAGLRTWDSTMACFDNFTIGSNP